MMGPHPPDPCQPNRLALDRRSTGTGIGPVPVVRIPASHNQNRTLGAPATSKQARGNAAVMARKRIRSIQVPISSKPWCPGSQQATEAQRGGHHLQQDPLHVRSSLSAGSPHAIHCFAASIAVLTSCFQCITGRSTTFGQPPAAASAEPGIPSCGRPLAPNPPGRKGCEEVGWPARLDVAAVVVGPRTEWNPTPARGPHSCLAPR